jgi:hypothetical protein
MISKDKFKKETNCKTNNSSMQFEVVNLGTSTTPQNINLGKNCSPDERQYYIKLFKEYKDIFPGHMKTSRLMTPRSYNTSFQ